MAANEQTSETRQLQLRIEPLPKVESIPAEGDTPERQRVYGAVWHGRDRIGLYSADLLKRDGSPRAVLTLGLMTWNDASREWEKLASAIEIRLDGDEYALTVLEANQSPFADSGELGRVLHRGELLQHPSRDTFLELAGHIASLDPKISGHFD